MTRKMNIGNTPSIETDMETSALIRRARALTLVQQERERQLDKWGEQTHDYAVWMTILTEELGEVSAELLEARLWCFNADGGQPYFQSGLTYRLVNMREELAQVAAVALAVIERIEFDIEHESGCRSLGCD